MSTGRGAHRFVLATALAAVLAMAGPATSARAEVSIAVLDDEGAAGGNRIIAHARPGERLQRRVQVGNRGEDPIGIRLYPAAASNAGGSFRFGDGAEQNELSRWITARPERFTVPPGHGANITVSVDVPEDAGAGEHYAVLWAELPSSGTSTAVVNRIGVRLYLLIADAEQPPATGADVGRSGVPVIATLAAGALAVAVLAGIAIRIRRR